MARSKLLDKILGHYGHKALMVKASNFFLKQAAKAERAAASTDERTSEEFINLAEAFRAQAEALKQKKPKKTKKK